jgi:hypothetical protein
MAINPQTDGVVGSADKEAMKMDPIAMFKKSILNTDGVK